MRCAGFVVVVAARLLALAGGATLASSDAGESPAAGRRPREDPACGGRASGASSSGIGTRAQAAVGPFFHVVRLCHLLGSKRSKTHDGEEGDKK